jgi:hypothetical protein
MSQPVFQGGSMMCRRFAVAVSIAALIGLTVAQGQGRSGAGLIRTDDLKKWLTYISSDELEGRAAMSEGLGLAQAYVVDELKALGVKPAGDNGTYFQRVSVLGVTSTSRSTVTVEVNGQSRTFKDGEALTLPKNVGGKRTLTFTELEFMGYGLNAPSIKYNDYEGKNVRGKLVVYLGTAGPKALTATAQPRRSPMAGRSRYATEQVLAAAVIGPEIPRPPALQQAAAAMAQARPAAPGTIPSDFTTVQRLDAPIPPAATVKADGGEPFWQFLFSASDVKYADLKAKADAQDALPKFTLKNVKVTFNIDTDYKIVQTQYTRNVVAVIPGSDATLAGTYVAFGAHLDHIGYTQGDPSARMGRGGAPGAPGAPPPPPPPPPTGPVDRISNGADDDGSGSVALLAVAKAFTNGPRPRRSLLFVWFTGEERGLWGSRYHADYGPGPDKIVAQLNLDMIGRNEGDKAEEANTVYVIGADRISTELHNINVDANQALPKPLTLDYEFNDPADPNNFYFRSDHYSYAAKGIPAIFFTTGEHPDYHRPTDSVEKIQWDKLTRITELVYETGQRVANLNHAPVRDNLGPRTGKGSSGKLPLTGTKS